MTGEIQDVTIEPVRRSFLERATIVWLVPVAAVLLAVGIALSTWIDRGPVIDIAFAQAGGIIANETQLKYRDVAVGVVEQVRFSPSLDEVIVSVRLDKNVAPFADDDAEFWIVRPEVSTSGVSGLETVLSGVFIEGTWDREPEGTVTSHTGRDEAPLVTAARPGLAIELRSARDSGLTENSPILFKSIEVGRVGQARISQDGQWIFADAIIYAPHDKLVTTATRFWDASGFSFTLGPAGAELDFSSVSSLITGGITFGTLVSGGEPVKQGSVFEVFPDQSAAQTSIFEASDGRTVTLAIIFEDNISGLTAEAPVEWRGVRIGKVLNVTGLTDAARFGDARVRLLTSIELQSSRFGLTDDPSEEDVLNFLRDRVAEGLRARLATASILTGGLKVELVTEEDAPPAELVALPGTLPLLPVTESEISDVSATAEGVFQRVNALPIEEVLDSVIAFLDNATALVSSEDVTATPGELRGLLAETRAIVGGADVQALPAELTAAMTDIRAATTDLRRILASLSDAGAAEKLAAALDQVSAVGAAAETALRDVPDLTGRIGDFIETANGLPLERLTEEATRLASDARALIGGEAATALPGDISEAARGLSAILNELAAANTAGELTAALTSAGAAAVALEEATQGLPGVVERVDRIVANAEAVKLDELASALQSTLDGANTLFGEAGEAELPQALARAFGEMEQALAELRAGGLVQSANSTLASTRDAAAAVAKAAEDLPALSERITRALAQAEATLEAYEGGSTFSREMEAALRDVQRAARSVDSLSRALERRPNSIILGR